MSIIIKHDTINIYYFLLLLIKGNCIYKINNDSSKKIEMIYG